MEWDELPRAGDLLILLGTLTLPLLTPLSRHYFLEPLHLVAKDRLSWEKNLQGTIAVRNGIALAGLFAITHSIAAFAGLQWKPKLWAIAFISCALVYLTLDDLLLDEPRRSRERPVGLARLLGHASRT